MPSFFNILHLSKHAQIKYLGQFLFSQSFIHESRLSYELFEFIKGNVSNLFLSSHLDTVLFENVIPKRHECLHHVIKVDCMNIVFSPFGYILTCPECTDIIIIKLLYRFKFTRTLTFTKIFFYSTSHQIFNKLESYKSFAWIVNSKFIS